MTLQSLIQSMKTKQMFVPMALIGVCLVASTPASAAFTSFSEAPNGIAPIAVSTDPSGVTNLVENGDLQLLTPPGFSVILPGVDLGGLVDLAVSARSDAAEGIEEVPGPVVGAGLLGLIAACGGLLALARRRRRT
jgi:hypothetical protein